MTTTTPDLPAARQARQPRVRATKSKRAPRRSWVKTVRKDWQIYSLAIAPLLFFAVFRYLPMIGNVIAFRFYQAGGPHLRHPVGRALLLRPGGPRPELLGRVQEHGDPGRPVADHRLPAADHSRAAVERGDQRQGEAVRAEHFLSAALPVLRRGRRAHAERPAVQRHRERGDRLVRALADHLHVRSELVPAGLRGLGDLAVHRLGDDPLPRGAHHGRHPALRGVR